MYAPRFFGATRIALSILIGSLAAAFSAAAHPDIPTKKTHKTIFATALIRERKIGRRVKKAEIAAVLLFAVPAWSCLAKGNLASASDGGGSGDATVDDAGIQIVPGMTVRAACAANPTGCLAGTATTARFTATPSQVKAKLYRVFPYGSEPPIGVEIVTNQAWAFGSLDGGLTGGLDPWAHYYVQLEVDFQGTDDAGGPSAVAAVSGPWSVPSSGQPIAMDVPPVQLNLLESRIPGGPMKVQWILAHVFDPATGDEIKAKAHLVAVQVGSTTLDVPWSGGDAGLAAYFLQLAQPLTAQASLHRAVAAPQFGPDGGTFPASPRSSPAFDGTIVAPVDGGLVPANQPSLCRLSSEPDSDYEVLQIFQSSGLSSVYLSPTPDPPNQLAETVEEMAARTS